MRFLLAWLVLTAVCDEAATSSTDLATINDLAGAAVCSPPTSSGKCPMFP